MVNMYNVDISILQFPSKLRSSMGVVIKGT